MFTVNYTDLALACIKQGPPQGNKYSREVCRIMLEGLERKSPYSPLVGGCDPPLIV